MTAVDETTGRGPHHFLPRNPQTALRCLEGLDTPVKRGQERMVGDFALAQRPLLGRSSLFEHVVRAVSYRAPLRVGGSFRAFEFSGSKLLGLWDARHEEMM
jgi:hypothetical protein